VPHEILVTLTRGALAESHHRGAYCVVRDGEILRSRGALEAPAYTRSAAKPFQALAVVDSGAPDQFGFTDAELALVVGSHSSAPLHTAAALSMFRKMGESPDLLRCGGHTPLDGKVQADYIRKGHRWGRIEDNCSGKHAGMIAAAKARGEDVKSYADRAHPLQQENLKNFATLTCLPVERVGVGVDGCAVPSFAAGVEALAHAAARYTTPDELPSHLAAAARRILASVHAHPEMVAGDSRFDTEVMRKAKRPLLSKMGAEGVQIIGVLDERLGIAIKIDDGARRACEAVAAALLIDLGLVTPEDLGDLYQRHVRTREGNPAGEIRVHL